MIVLLSPAKTLDFDSPEISSKSSSVRFQEESQQLIKKLRTLSSPKLQKLMSISPNLAKLNKDRYLEWQIENTPKNSKQAGYAFKGDVYLGLEFETFLPEDVDQAQRHLRILSGLYGLIRPLDRIQPYRLEMGTKLLIRRKKNLYQFWGDKILLELRKDLDDQGDNVIINLASKEYFESIDFEKLGARTIVPQFRYIKNGELKFISFFAKKARGLMTSYILKNRIKDPEKLKQFNWEGYSFSEKESAENEWFFIRNEDEKG